MVSYLSILDLIHSSPVSGNSSSILSTYVLGHLVCMSMELLAITVWVKTAQLGRCHWIICAFHWSGGLKVETLRPEATDKCHPIEFTQARTIYYYFYKVMSMSGILP